MVYLCDRLKVNWIPWAPDTPSILHFLWFRILPYGQRDGLSLSIQYLRCLSAWHVVRMDYKACHRRLKYWPPKILQDFSSISRASTRMLQLIGSSVTAPGRAPPNHLGLDRMSQQERFSHSPRSTAVSVYGKLYCSFIIVLLLSKNT